MAEAFKNFKLALGTSSATAYTCLPATTAIVDPDYYCRWKTESGFVELDSLQIKGIAQAVRLYVQSCFDREAELLPLIEAAESPEELNKIVW